MRCPYCGKDDTRVIDSRPVEDNNSIRRRRICDSCGKRFTTYEKIEMIPMMVTKKDNNREIFDRSKIEGGILRACHKRPVSAAQIKKIVDEIELTERPEIGTVLVRDVLGLDSNLIVTK
jgi:transcriptional repressor NrdR